MKYLVSALFVIIIFLAAGLSYYVGKSSVNPNNMAASVTGNPQLSVTAILTSSPSSVPSKVINAGGILSFPKYNLTVSEDWKYSRESQTKDDERVILSSGDYQLTITQGGFGGSVCLFPGDSDTEGPSARYENFVEIKTQSNDQLRRAWTGTETEAKGFGICQNTQYGWGLPTSYGHISYNVPPNPTNQKLREMDSILASLTKE